MLESTVRESARLAAVAFPLVIPLFFYNRLFNVRDYALNSAKELKGKDEAIIKYTLPLAMVVAFAVPGYVQWRVFLAVPLDHSLFSLRLSHYPIFLLSGYLVQGLAVAFLVHLLLAKCIFGSRFESDIFHAKASRSTSGSVHARVFEFRWFVHPTGKVRTMLWLGGIIATLANISFEGTYLEVDHAAVRENIFWVDKKDYPISSIQEVILTRRYGRFARVNWSVKLHLKDGQSRPLLGGLEISTANANRLSQTLRKLSNETIEFREIS